VTGPVLQVGPDGTALSADGQVLPVGGPYPVAGGPDVLVGELWVLAGQSNMEGLGLLSGTEAPHPLIRVYGSDETWSRAQEPLHDLPASPRAVHARLMAEAGHVPPAPGKRLQGAGLGLAFARRRTKETGLPIGLISCAHGGTSMSQWSAEGPDDLQDSLYGAMLDRVRACGSKVAGVLWYQGESDVGAEDWPRYDERMTAWLAALRADLARPELPLLMVQLGRVIGADDPNVVLGWNEIRERQRHWAASQPGVEIVAAIDLELDDFIHIDTAGLRTLGFRLAQAQQGHAGLQPAGAVMASSPLGTPSLHLTVAGVAGQLRSSGPPTGFSLRDAQGDVLPLIYKVELRGDAVLLHLTGPLPVSDARLWYGWGLNPVCNVVDQAGQALLAFTLSLDQPQAPPAFY